MNRKTATPEEWREYINAWRQRRREAALAQLGGKCSRCSSTTGLEFDHVDPTTKLLTIANMWTASEARFQAELAKCQLLCKPCHLEKTSLDGSNPGRKVGPIRHGTLYAYEGRRCRCEDCRRAKRDSRHHGSVAE